MKFVIKISLILILLSIIGFSSAVKQSRSCKGNTNNPECAWVNIVGPGGLCIASKGNTLVQDDCSTNPEVMWNFISVGNDAYIQNKNGKVIDNAESKNKNKNKVVSWNLHGGNNQKWFIEYVKNGNNLHFKLHGTNKCLDNTGEIKKGINYHIWDCNNSNKNQHFDIRLPANHNWYNIVDRHGKCVSARYGDGELQKDNCGNGDDLLWAFIPGKMGYVIINKKNGKVFNNSGNGTNNGNKQISWTRSQADNELWRIQQAANGKVMFRNVQSNKCFDNCGTLKNNFFIQYDCVATQINQHFDIKLPPPPKPKPTPKSDPKISPKDTSSKLDAKTKGKIFCSTNCVRNDRATENKCAEGQKLVHCKRCTNKPGNNDASLKQACELVCNAPSNSNGPCDFYGYMNNQKKNANLLLSKFGLTILRKYLR